MSGGAENTIFVNVLDNFPIWSMLLIGNPVQRSPVTIQGVLRQGYVCFLLHFTLFRACHLVWWFRACQDTLTLTRFHWSQTKTSESVECRFSKCRGRQQSKKKRAWVCSFTLPPCGYRCRFGEVCIFFCSAPTIINKIERIIQTQRWRLLRWHLTLSENCVARSRADPIYQGPSNAHSLQFGKYPLGCSSMCWLSWFSGPGFCSCPGFHLGLGASDCSPGLAVCFTGPWTLLGSAARSYPTTRAKKGRTAHVFTAQGGTCRETPVLAKFRPIFSRCSPIFCQLFSQFRPILAKETPECFDKIKAGEFTLKLKVTRDPVFESGVALIQFHLIASPDAKLWWHGVNVTLLQVVVNLANLVHHNAATHNAAMHNASFSQRYPYPFFLQRHRCDALPCFSASLVEIFYITHIALRPLLPFFLSPQWFTVQNNKKFAKSHNAAMSPLATRDGQRKRKRKRSDAVH